MREEPQVKPHINFPVSPPNSPLNSSPSSRILLPYAHLSSPHPFLAGRSFRNLSPRLRRLSLLRRMESPPRPRRSQRHDDPHHSPFAFRSFLCRPRRSIRPLLARRPRSLAQGTPHAAPPRRFRLHECRSRLDPTHLLPGPASRLRSLPPRSRIPPLHARKIPRRNRAPPRSH